MTPEEEFTYENLDSLGEQAAQAFLAAWLLRETMPQAEWEALLVRVLVSMILQAEQWGRVYGLRAVPVDGDPLIPEDVLERADLDALEPGRPDRREPPEDFEQLEDPTPDPEPAIDFEAREEELTERLEKAVETLAEELEDVEIDVEDVEDIFAELFEEEEPEPEPEEPEEPEDEEPEDDDEPEDDEPEDEEDLDEDDEDEDLDEDDDEPEGRAQALVGSYPDLDRVLRLARNEVVHAAQEGYQDGFRLQSDVEWGPADRNPDLRGRTTPRTTTSRIRGYRRGINPDACEICFWTWKEGFVYPLDQPMFQHIGCRCVPVPTTDPHGAWKLDATQRDLLDKMYALHMN